MIESIITTEKIQILSRAEKVDKPPVFVTGGTGYIGSRLAKKLLGKNYRVIVLVRKGSENKVPKGTEVIVGNPFDARTFAEHIPFQSIFVQLLGVPHPSPKKANLFKEIDLKSVKASADTALQACVSHFIYISVAMSPSNIMKVYQEVRKEGENYCLSRDLNCSFIRPWYVVGPGHWWPVLLLPFYGIAELIPSWRSKARSKALVSIRQILKALTRAIKEKPVHHSVFEIKDIRNS
ncbi:MAG TPA: NAD(P)H-binding protein [Chitinophagaceae bacterium]|jgi:nucleoside-diphosphate-sugar epimerase